MVIVVSVCSEWKPGPRSSAVDERGQVVLKDHNLSSAGSDTFFLSNLHSDSLENMTKNTLVEMLRNIKWYSKITTSVQQVCQTKKLYFCAPDNLKRNYMRCRSGEGLSPQLPLCIRGWGSHYHHSSSGILINLKTGFLSTQISVFLSMLIPLCLFFH